MIDFIKFLIFLLKRPKMFFIQRVDDFYFIVAGYIAGKEEEDYGLFIDEFSKYLSIKYNFKKGTLYNLIIRSMTIYDEVTLEILKEEMYSFLSSKKNQMIHFRHSINIDELNKLLSNIRAN